MHFWIDKRGLAGQRRPPSTVWLQHSAPKPATRVAMAAPVHRYATVPPAADATSVRLYDTEHPTASLSVVAGQSASGSTSDTPASARPPPTDEVDCMPCCCVLSSTVIGVFTLTAVQMYLEHVFHHSATGVDPTGLVFLFAFLFVCLLFFARMVGLSKRRTREAEAPAVVSLDALGHRTSVSEGESEPPPYEEAVRLPAPPIDSPPPAYDKVSALTRL